jgi:hypothetical protein
LESGWPNIRVGGRLDPSILPIKFSVLPEKVASMRRMKAGIAKPMDVAEGSAVIPILHGLNEVGELGILVPASSPLQTDRDAVLAQPVLIALPHENGGMSNPRCQVLAAKSLVDLLGFTTLFPETTIVKDSGTLLEIREGEKGLHVSRVWSSFR